MKEKIHNYKRNLDKNGQLMWIGANYVGTHLDQMPRVNDELQMPRHRLDSLQVALNKENITIYNIIINNNIQKCSNSL